MASFGRILLSSLVSVGACASTLDTIGFTSLRLINPNLTGQGLTVGQAEAGTPTWEVNPAAVGQPVSLFTWTSSSGSTNAYPNPLGNESGHADQVGGILYGASTGLAPGVQRMDNYEAGYFSSLVQNQTAIAARLVNQSFIFSGQLTTVDRDYDNYVARYHTLFISGVGNSGSPSSPATAYNGLAVGALDGQSSLGPTSDGRAKPDLTAPASQTSFSTPLVSGGVALMLEAAAQDVGGAGSAAAAGDDRTIKALLLNGAQKPGNWTNGVSTPLDARYGAGVLNLFRSYRQLRGGKHAFVSQASYGQGNPHPPPVSATDIPARRGWDWAAITSSVTEERAHHYYFQLTGSSNQWFTMTATLVWERQQNQVSVNNLDLFLYEADTGALRGASQSSVDNVEHLYVTGLAPGRYVLQVLKWGGLLERVTNEETYALAFEFGPAAPATIVNPDTASGQFQARLVGEPYEFYIIQASPNFIDWTGIVTNQTSAEGFFDFVDSSPEAAPGLFYRSVLAP
jgi:Subtilase family